MKREVLRLIGVSTEDYKFGGIRDATFSLYRGETLALSGLYDSGKKTLVRILCGELPGYNGSIYINGNEVFLNSRETSRKHGIANIGEKRLLFDNMSVLDNVYIVEAEKKLISTIDKKSTAKKVRQFFKLFDIDTSCKYLDTLTNFEKIKLEILKVFIGGAQIMVFSDVFMYCNKEEARSLSRIIKMLNTFGVSVILDSDEYFDLFEETIDVCTVVRKGIVTTTVFKGEDGHFDNNILYHVIMGKAQETCSARLIAAQENNSGNSLFMIIDKITGKSVYMSEGNIVGIHDQNLLIPRNYDSLIKLFSEKYKICFNGNEVRIDSIRAMVENRIAIIARENDNHLVFKNLSPVENVSVLVQPFLARRRIYDRHVSEYIFNSVIYKYEILENCIELKDRNDCYGLSYEQQYEIMIAKWMAINPRIVILHSPNYDAKNALRYQKFILRMAEEDRIPIIISSNYDYLSSLCTHILAI